MTQKESKQEVTKMIDKYAAKFSNAAYLGVNLSVCDVYIVHKII